ncbi:MAG: hypothetical protein OEZ68_15730 [Gammaproteobacteria bacterium]|nr:hypothetical protein [Gammaproteobacteria bacterium]MDH5802251.1 hypothetical protein [Gammaproteobacteria bacterium]
MHLVPPCTYNPDHPDNQTINAVDPKYSAVFNSEEQAVWFFDDGKLITGKHATQLLWASIEFEHWIKRYRDGVADELMHL